MAARPVTWAMRACSCTFLAHDGSPLCITWQPLLLLLCWQVKADGSPAERVDKHPFCMSRVFYDATEKPEEVRRGSVLRANALPSAPIWLQQPCPQSLHGSLTPPAQALVAVHMKGGRIRVLAGVLTCPCAVLPYRSGLSWRTAPAAGARRAAKSRCDPAAAATA